MQYMHTIRKLLISTPQSFKQGEVYVSISLTKGINDTSTFREKKALLCKFSNPN